MKQMRLVSLGLDKELWKGSESTSGGRRRGRWAKPPTPRASGAGVNGYSHLLNGSAEACLQPPKVGDGSVMLNEGMGSSGNHFGSSLVTSTFAAARSAAAHGDDFTAFLRLHTLVTFLHLLLFPFRLKILKETW